MSDIEGLDVDQWHLVVDAAKRWSSELVVPAHRDGLLHAASLDSVAFDVAALAAGTRRSEALSKFISGSPMWLSELIEDGASVAQTSARSILRRAESNFDEFGVRTAHVGVGLATWIDLAHEAVPSAPVLLCAVDLTADPGGSDDIEVALVGQWFANPALLAVLADRYGLASDLDSAVLAASAGLTVRHIDQLLWDIEQAASAAGTAVPGFSITRHVQISNVDSVSAATATEVRSSGDRIATHPILNACARMTGVPPHVTQPGPAPPLGDHDDSLWDDLGSLILDADPDQRRVVAAVLGGGHVKVNAPPGTGSTQTVANLMASMVSAHRSVLYVSDKRASIDAVRQRLASVGLGDLVTDLRAGGSSGPDLVARLDRARLAAASVESNVEWSDADVDPGDGPRGDPSAGDSTQTIEDYIDAIHRPRAPWGVSLIDLHGELAAVAGDPAARWESEGLHRTTIADLPALAATVVQWMALGGPHCTEMTTTVWAPVFGRATTPEHISLLLAMLHSVLDEDLPELRHRLSELARSLGIEAPDGLDRARSLLDLLSDLEGAELRGDRELASSIAPSSPGHSPRRSALLSALSERWAEFAPHHDLPTVPMSTTGVIGVFERVTEAVDALVLWLGPADLRRVTFEHLEQRLRLLEDQRSILEGFPTISDLRTRLVEAGVAAIADEIAERSLPANEVIDAMQLAWCASIRATLLEQEPWIESLEASGLAHAMLEVDRAQEEAHAEAASRVESEWRSWVTGVVAAHPDWVDLVRDLCGEQPPATGVGTIVSRAPELVTSLLPCWAMSSRVVAEALPLIPDLFDVVILDDAATLSPAVATPAMLRARQVVIIGDAHQMWPRPFHAAGPPDGDVGPERWSVADVGSAETGVVECALRHEYRSVDERLVACSNADPGLYRSQLVTTPGAAGDALRSVIVDITPGAESPEWTEATSVAALVAEHAQQRGAESLLVVAMSDEHAARVQDAIGRLSVLDPVLAAFVAGATQPPGRDANLTVSGVDHVQAETRDAVILTVGHGRRSDGGFTGELGVIDRPGGERRMNVAATRARRRLTVVTTVAARDLDSSQISPGGAVLRRLLEACEIPAPTTTHLATPLGAPSPHTSGGATHDERELSSFEHDMYIHLSRAGIPVVVQYGSTDGRVEFALGHPEQPGRMVLALESDCSVFGEAARGPRLCRQRRNHLRRAGWGYEFVWASLWFTNRTAELARIVQAWRTAVYTGQ